MIQNFKITGQVNKIVSRINTRCIEERNLTVIPMKKEIRENFKNLQAWWEAHTMKKIKKKKENIVQERELKIEIPKNGKNNIVKFVAQKRCQSLKVVVPERCQNVKFIETEILNRIKKLVERERCQIIKYVAQEKGKIIKYAAPEKCQIIKYVAPEKCQAIKYIAFEKYGKITKPVLSEECDSNAAESISSKEDMVQRLIHNLTFNTFERTSNSMIELFDNKKYIITKERKISYKEKKINDQLIDKLIRNLNEDLKKKKKKKINRLKLKMKKKNAKMNVKFETS